MDLTRAITSAENKYKQILEGFFISNYNEKLLPSHGIDHHRRVWQTAKELTMILAEDISSESFHLPSLLIASYLHDLGMAVDHGPKHGRHSLEFCKRFLKENNLEESDFPGLFRAVLDHDNKDYPAPSGINVHTLLSVADDLDAFGFTGIYRYTEIYTVRGIMPEDLGYRVRENAMKRYLHFEDLFSSHAPVISKHKCRFEILDSFFDKYNNHLKNRVKGSGYLRVINILTGMVINGKNPGELIMEYEEDIDPVVRYFFLGLKSEAII